MKMSVGTKIGAGFGLALVILVAINAVSYWNTASLTRTADQRAHSHQVLDELASVGSALKDAETGQRGFVITGLDRYLDPYTNARPAIDKSMKELRSLTSDNANQQRRLDRLEPLIYSTTGKLAELQETIDLRRGGSNGFDAALQVVLTDRGKQIMDDIRQIIDEMSVEENGLLQVREEEARSSARTTTLTILIGTAAAFVILAIAGFMITRNIAVPLKGITDVAGRIANGDLSANLPSSTRSDEIGVLMRVFERMQLSLRAMAAAAEQIAALDLRTEVKPQSADDALGNAFARMVENLRMQNRQLAEAASVLAAAATEIVATAAQVASSASETASAVSETTSTVEEVKQTAQLVSEKATDLSDSAQRAAQVSNDGRRAAEAAVDGMHNIHRQVESLGQSMVRLSEQNQSIAEIIATVNALAEQSNLLAVNASIEAAKAGDAGRGFAVVANEVKALAEQSKQATAQVRGILGDIQKATSAAVLATEQGSRAVEGGLKQATESGQAIGLLAESVAEATQAALQIAASSNQQLVGMDQVALAMENINQASSQNASSTRQTELAAQNLHELGQKLGRLVEQYQV